MIEHVNDADAIDSRTLMPALHEVADQATGGLPWSRLRRVVEYVQTNLTGELSLAELSAQVYMSPYHFARLFKKSIGVSPRQFVIRRRIEAAKLLLAERPRPVGEVALAVGFCSKSHFTTIFRQITGVTPGHYRVVGHKDDLSGATGGAPEPSLSPWVDRGLASRPAGEMADSARPGHRRDSEQSPGLPARQRAFRSIGILPKGVPECTSVAGQSIKSAKGGLK